jgi:hypothetical protein
MIVTFSPSFPESGTWRKRNCRQSDVPVGLAAIHPDSSTDGLVLSSSWPNGCLKCDIAKLGIQHAHAARLAWPLENCEMIGSVYCFPVQQSDLIVTILFCGVIYNEFAMAEIHAHFATLIQNRFICNWHDDGCGVETDPTKSRRGEASERKEAGAAPATSEEGRQSFGRVHICSHI